MSIGLLVVARIGVDDVRHREIEIARNFLKRGQLLLFPLLFQLVLLLLLSLLLLGTEFIHVISVADSEQTSVTSFALHFAGASVRPEIRRAVISSITFTDIIIILIIILMSILITITIIIIICKWGRTRKA